MPSKPTLKLTAQRGLRRLFELGQRAGFDLLPSHFYSEIPAIAELRAQSRWRRPRDLSAISGSDVESQLSFLHGCCPPAILARMPPSLYDDACAENGAVGFGPIEAQVLYCFIASRRPRRVVQIGCGVSTAVILKAGRDFGHEMQLTCVDPYPTSYLSEAASGRIELIARKAQDVGLQRLTELDSGDLLFVDSTHTVKPGSEVNRIVLEVLPCLAPGVYIHFHDVLFPYDYSPTLLANDLFFWNESVLLQAFLTHNARCALRVALSMIHHAAPEALVEILPGYRPARFEAGLLSEDLATSHFPSSAYLEVAGEQSRPSAPHNTR
ncbi:MAG: class I SAM-dependent methyltransferase [Solirubrobacteraceae bacterium]